VDRLAGQQAGGAWRDGDAQADLVGVADVVIEIGALDRVAAGDDEKRLGGLTEA